MKLGAQLFSVRNHLQTPEDILSTFKRVKEIGYQNVQLSGNAYTSADILLDIVEKTEMPIVCTHTPYARIIGETEKVIEEHKKFRCPVIGLGMMPNELQGSVAGLEKFLEELKEPVKKIQKAGLNFSYHNHAFELAPSPDSDRLVYDIMLERCPDWGFILDTYWVKYAGFSPIEYIAKIGSERLTNIHFKDMANDKDRTICACGQGTMDFAEIYEACVKMNVENVLIEQDNAALKPDPFGEMEISFNYLRDIVK